MPGCKHRVAEDHACECGLGRDATEGDPHLFVIRFFSPSMKRGRVGCRQKASAQCNRIAGNATTPSPAKGKRDRGKDDDTGPEPSRATAHFRSVRFVQAGDRERVETVWAGHVSGRGVPDRRSYCSLHRAILHSATYRQPSPSSGRRVPARKGYRFRVAVLRPPTRRGCLLWRAHTHPLRPNSHARHFAAACSFFHAAIDRARCS